MKGQWLLINDPPPVFTPDEKRRNPKAAKRVEAVKLTPTIEFLTEVTTKNSAS